MDIDNALVFAYGQNVGKARITTSCMLCRALSLGVLSIIGSFCEHSTCLRAAQEQIRTSKNNFLDGYRLHVTEVRAPKQLDVLDGLIIPGGESTVITAFLRENGFYERLKTWSDRPTKFTWGTCAGLILLANDLKNAGTVKVANIGGIDISCSRDVQGRQNISYLCPVKILDNDLANPLGVAQNLQEQQTYPGVFINPPAINSINSEHVARLCVRPPQVAKDAPAGIYSETELCIAVRQGNKMASTFHPELSHDMRWHIYFIKHALKNKCQ